MASAIPRASRVKQWLLFARQWHIADANSQDLWKLARKVATHLAGANKPIYHPETDCGDHVVVVNCKDVSMHGFDWKHTQFYFNRGYPKSKVELAAYQIHEFDPCRVMWLATARELVDVTRCPTSNRIVQRRCLNRLHLFPDDEMPEFIRENVSNQLKNVQPVSKKTVEYSEEERKKAFPRIFELKNDHVMDWNDNAEPPEWYADDCHPAKVEPIK